MKSWCSIHLCGKSLANVRALLPLRIQLWVYESKSFGKNAIIIELWGRCGNRVSKESNFDNSFFHSRLSLKVCQILNEAIWTSKNYLRRIELIEKHVLGGGGGGGVWGGHDRVNGREVGPASRRGHFGPPSPAPITITAGRMAWRHQHHHKYQIFRLAQPWKHCQGLSRPQVPPRYSLVISQ